MEQTAFSLYDWKTLLETLLQELAYRAQAHYRDNLVSLVVFGSVARGTATPESDIDLLILLREKPPGSHAAYMDYLQNVEEKLPSLARARSMGWFPRFSPILLKAEALRVDMPWLWGGTFRVLYDTGFFQAFLERLRAFEQEHLAFVPSPIPHYVVKKPW